MKRKLFLLLCALLTSVGMWAQGTWTAPAVPSVDPSTVDGTTTYYLYNVESDAFVAYGMSWQSQAIARRLCNGDQAASDMHKMTASISDSKLSFHFNDVKDANRLLSDNSGENNCYVDTWTGNATKFTYAATTTSGAYTLTNVETGHELDVHWKYGGHLTGTNGQGFTAWAIIPETSIINGSYAKYKEKKQMYGVYQALVAAGVVSSYTTALETANAVYVNNSSTVSQLRTATRTLINAAAEDIASSINGNSLFDDTDIWGNQALTTWTSTAASNSDYGEYETYNIHYDFDQTHDVPNGSYKIIFHSLFRNDGGGTAPRIIVTDGEKDGGGTSASANVPLFTSFDFTPTNNNSSGNMSVAKSSYFSDWVENNNVWIPNGRRSSADAMAHTNAVASVDNFKVTTGKMNIRLIIDQDNQWVNFQGFDIVFYGSTTGKLYRDLVELLETANALATQPMNATVLNNLNSAIAAYSNLSKSSSEEDLEAAIAAVTTANTNAETSISIYSSIEAAITEYATKASTLDAAGQAAYDDSGVVAKYNNGTYETEAEAEADLQAALAVAAKAQTTNGADMTAVIANPSFETGTDDGWTVNSGAGLVVRNQGELSNMVGNYYALIQRNGSDRFVSQTINSLHQGKYVLSVNAMANTDAGNVTLNLGTFSTSIPSNATAATYTVAYETAESANAEIKIAATGGEGTLRRCFFDYFTLTYYTELPDVDITELAAKPMKASVLSALNNASTTYAGSKTVTNYNSLQNAIVEAKISAEIYSAYATYEAKAVANLTAAGLESFNSDATVAAYYNGTYEGTETQEDAIKTAYVSALKVYPVVGADFTDIITNPSFEDNDGGYQAPIGWTLEGEAEGIQTQNNSGFDGYKVGKMFGERWGASSIKNFDANQTITGLPTGLYELKAVATFNGTGGYLYAGDKEVNVTDAKYYSVFVYLANDNSSLKIGVKNKNDDDGSWFKCDDFTLTYHGDDFTGIIKDADCKSNDGWPSDGSGGREQPEKTDWTGTSRKVFGSNRDGGWGTRHQDVTFPVAGMYRLDVYGLIEAETGEFGAKVVNNSSEILVQKEQKYNQSLNHYLVTPDGTEGDALKTTTTGWTIEELYFNVPNANDVETIHLYLSRSGGNTKYGYIGGLKLTYLGAAGDTCNAQVSATAKVGTFCAPYDVKVPARVTAHTVSQGSGDWISLSDPLEGGIIPAGTPVILQAEEDIAIAIQKTYFGTGNEAPSDSYVLKGLYEAEEKTSGANPYYILQYVAEDGGAGFYRVPTGQKRYLAANRCYLQPESGSMAARIAIGGEDDPTAINEVEVIESEAKTMKDGKYFVKGRIVIVKNGKAFSTNGQKLN